MITNLVVTAYCVCKICCGSHASGLTASGDLPREGITIAASRSIPFGTHVHITGFTNDFIVQDRLAKRYDSRVDIYMASHRDALRFGKRTLQVTVYKQP